MTILDLRPSWVQVFWDAQARAKGLSYFDAIGFAIRGHPQCYICGRQRDFIFDFVRLIPYKDMSLDNKLVYVCDDHGRVTDRNCITDESLQLPLPRSYWYRWIRNTLQFAVLKITILARFIWFFAYIAFMWYVAIWPWWLWKQYKTNR
jgi:hypothetical protein